MSGPKEISQLIERAIRNPKEVLKFLYNHPRAYTRAKYCQIKYDKQYQLLTDLQNNDDSWLLIVLDACRYDILDEYFNDYFEGQIRPAFTYCRNTFQYMRTNWEEKYSITYISAATPVNSEVDFESGKTETAGMRRDSEKLIELYQGYTPSNHIREIIDVWKTHWDPKLGVAPPEPVTDCAIEKAKTVDRLVVHYFQPHQPYIGKTNHRENIDSHDDAEYAIVSTGAQERAKNGEISNSRLRQLYRDTLLRVLSQVCRLVRKTDFNTIVLIGDHGESLGEYSLYGHPDRANPYIQTVPWAKIQDVKHVVGNAHSKKDHTTEEGTVSERLEDLGYIP